MTLNDHFALCFKIHAFSEPTTKVWMKIDPYCQRQRCSAMTVVSGNMLWSVRIFAGVPWRRGVKRQWGSRNVGVQGFRTLRLWHVRNRKWGQHYYIVLFSPLSPFQWPQNTWPWVTLNGHFMLAYIFTHTNSSLRNYFYVVTAQSDYTRDQRTCADADRDPQNIWDPRKNCRSFVDVTSSEL